MASLRRFSAALGFIPAALLLLWGISAFGIWDPWELNIADAARAQAEGGEAEALRGPTFTVWLLAKSFAMFGVSELSGRAPIALGALVLAAAAYFLARRYDDARAGILACLVVASAPIVLLNGRGMFGDAYAMAGNALVGLFAARIAFGKAERKAALLALDALGLVVAIALGTAAAGVLSGVLPPLLAIACVAALRLPDLSGAARIRAAAISALGFLAAAFTAKAVIADGAAYSHWLGGAPFGGEPPTFDAGLERVFHGFGAWAGLMVIALGRLLAPRKESPEGGAGESDDAPSEAQGAGSAIPESFFVRLSLLLWTAFGYGALMLYTARYGETTFHSVAPVAVAIAMLLRDLVRSKRSWWGEAVVAGLFTVLILRDYALFPGTAVDSLPLLDVTLPEVFNPRRAWAAVLVLFLGALVLVFAAGESFLERPDLRAPYRFLATRWGGTKSRPVPLIVGGVAASALIGAFAAFAGNIGLAVGVLLAPVLALAFLIGATRPKLSASAGWLCFALFLGVLLLAFGLACMVAGSQLQLASIALRAGKRLVVVLLSLPFLLSGAQVVLWLGAKLGQARLVPLMIAGVAFGGYASMGYLPALSAHFSPRAVYDMYNELHAEGEPLVEYRVSGRAAAYYAEGDDIEEVESQSELLTYLGGEARTWAVIPADQLPAINRAFRGVHHRHLFVADAENARLALVSGTAPEGARNANFIAEVVLDEVPTTDVSVSANFNNRIGLVGYDLETPGDQDYVGAGQTFTIVWYWRALSRIPGSYKSFLHIDGQGNRLNGDHEPVDGRYPVRLWDEGDIIVDRQELTVPANYRPGAYTIWVGFFSGSTRLEVTDGPHDDSNRVNAGRLIVR